MHGRGVRGRGVWAVVAVLVVVAGCGGDGGGSAEGGEGEKAARVVLEPVGSRGEDPFTEAVAIDEVAEFPEAVMGVVAEGVAAAGGGGVVLAGGTPGLYGGTEDADACDVGQLVEFLTDEANADKAEAFAGALGIEVGDIADHLVTLTPVVLIADAVVTNHGFRDGRATPFTAVLQAGTAVLVDAFGVPRVKCACGNPLGEPPPRVDLGRTEGQLWDGYDPSTTVAVGPSGEALGSLTLTDTTTGDAYQRPVGATPPAPALDVRNITLPPGLCSDDAPLTLVDGAYQSEGDGVTENFVESAGIAGEPIDADLDGDGTPEVTFALSCFTCGISCGNFSLVVTVRAGPDGGAELVAQLPPRDVPTNVESLTFAGSVLALEGITFGPNDNEADGPTLPVSSRWQFEGGAWVAA